MRGERRRRPGPYIVLFLLFMGGSALFNFTKSPSYAGMRAVDMLSLNPMVRVIGCDTLDQVVYAMWPEIH